MLALDLQSGARLGSQEHRFDRSAGADGTNECVSSRHSRPRSLASGLQTCVRRQCPSSMFASVRVNGEGREGREVANLDGRGRNRHYAVRARRVGQPRKARCASHPVETAVG